MLMMLNFFPILSTYDDMDAVFQAISSETLVCIRSIVMQLNSVCVFLAFAYFCIFQKTIHIFASMVVSKMILQQWQEKQQWYVWCCN